MGVLLAVTVLSFVVLPFYLAFDTSRKATVKSSHMLLAANYASSLMEKYKQMEYAGLERLLLHLPEGDSPPDLSSLRGPFEPYSSRPDVVEKHVEQGVELQAEIYLSYFPDPEPDPESPRFYEARRRILIKIVVSWEERGRKRGSALLRSIELAAVVHDEAYRPRPSLARLGGEEGAR